MTEAIAGTRRERRPDRARTKAIIAIAAGAILLLGGGTTLAYWSTTQTITGVDTTSGNLDFTPTSAATWELVSEGGTVTAPLTATSRIVPGDFIRMTQDVTLALDGDNLFATFTAVVDGAQPTGLLEPEVAVEDSSGAPVSNGLTKDDNGETVTVMAEFQFDPTTGTDVLTTTDFDINDVTLTLTQTAAP